MSRWLSVQHYLSANNLVLGIVAAVMVFVRSGDWVFKYIGEPYVTLASFCLISIVPVSLALLSVPKTRGWGYLGLYGYSYILLFGLWVTCLCAVEQLWGKLATLAGLLMFGYGVIPMAAIAILVKGYWKGVGALILIVALAAVIRSLPFLAFCLSTEND
jgi:hypothetical protein